MQIKNTLRHYFTPTRMAQIKKTDHTKCSQGDGANETLIYRGCEDKVVQAILANS